MFPGRAVDCEGQERRYLAGGDVQTLLVGIDDCKTFTAPDIHAVGQMANDYFYERYVEKLRP